MQHNQVVIVITTNAHAAQLIRDEVGECLGNLQDRGMVVSSDYAINDPEPCCPEGKGECSSEPGHVAPSEGHCPNCCPDGCTDCAEPESESLEPARRAPGFGTG